MHKFYPFLHLGMVLWKFTLWNLHSVVRRLHSAIQRIVIFSRIFFWWMWTSSICTLIWTFITHHSFTQKKKIAVKIASVNGPLVYWTSSCFLLNVGPIYPYFYRFSSILWRLKKSLSVDSTIRSLRTTGLRTLAWIYMCGRRQLIRLWIVFL
jgi:hypothetical protein